MKKIILILTILSVLLSSVACGTQPSDKMTNSDNADNSSKNESAAISSTGDTSTSTSNASDESDESSEVTSTTEQKTIENISVTIVGENQLKSNGYRISGDFSMSVSVIVTGSNFDLINLKDELITASVDVSNVKETGDISLAIDFNAPEGITIISRSESIANLTIKKVSNEVTPPPAEDDVRIVNGVLISGTRAMEQFGGSSNGGAGTAQKLNAFKTAMGDVNVYALPAPLASAFYAPEGYERSITRHQECFYGMRDALVNVGFVDTLSAIAPHVDEAIYFRTDHHWQALAAYYACEEFASVAGVSFDPLSTFVVKSEEGVLGSFYSSYTHDAVLGNNPDTMIWYEPTRAYTVDYYSRSGFKGQPTTGRTLFSTNKGYTKFIYGDSYTSHIKTNVGNGRKLLLFKDSYGNALAPFLVGSFDEIIIADYRYFENDVSDFIASQGITDVCFSIAAFGVNNFKGLNLNY